jgi:hypothetical protein
MFADRRRLGIAAVGFVMLVLIILVVIAMIGPGATEGIPTQDLTILTTTPPASTAAIVLNPAAAAAGQQVTITGSGFPPNAAVSIHLGTTGAVLPEAPTYAQATADAQGVFSLAILVPDTWPDGTPISSPNLTVTASEPGGAVASAALTYGGGAPAVGTTPVATPVAAETLATYTNPDLGISLQYPALWLEDPAQPGRFNGDDGYFSVQAAGAGMTLEETCAEMMATDPGAYGATPETTSQIIAGQPACLVMPSADAPGQPVATALLVVTFPTPVTIDGVAYNHLVLHADQGHVLSIGQTITFAPAM